MTGNRYNSSGEKLPTQSSTTIPLIQGHCHFKHDEGGDPIFTTNFNIFNDEILVSNDSQYAACYWIESRFFFFLFPVSICHLIWMNGGMNVTKMNQLSNLMCKAERNGRI